MQKESLLEQNSVEQLTDSAVKAIKEKKGQEIASLDLRGIEEAEAEFMIISHASSDVHAKAIAEYVEETLAREFDEKPFQIEGIDNKEWILLDYINVMVHIFLEEKRRYYSLEELWGDAEIKYH